MSNYKFSWFISALSIESYSHLLGFYIIKQSDWLQKTAPFCHPIRSKCQSYRDSLALVFPRRLYTSPTCIFFELWLVHCIVYVLFGKSDNFGFEQFSIE